MQAQHEVLLAPPPLSVSRPSGGRNLAADCIHKGLYIEDKTVEVVAAVLAFQKDRP